MAKRKVTVECREGPNGPRYYLGDAYPDIYLTTREGQLCLLIDEYRYRDLALRMGISKRTIEYYVMNIKKKLSCKTKQDLIRFIHESGLFEQLAVLIDVSEFR